MGADRLGPRRHLRRAGHRSMGTGALLVCGVLLLVGCASMPDSGDVRKVDSSPHGDVDSQVRVYGVRPVKGEQPMELVFGFLEATTSDEENFGTAKEYLTKDEARDWNPFAATTVLAQGPEVAIEHTPDQDGGGVTLVLTGKQLATVDAKHAYRPGEQDYTARIHVAKSGAEWRIDSVPPGLVLGQSDFQRIYRSINKYYFAELGPDAQTPGAGDNVLVADPVYLRRRIDPVTSTVKALLDGPTSWLDPVVSTSFPGGTALDRKDEELSLDSSNGLRVRLSHQAADVNQVRCHRMAAQLLFTVQDQASVEVSSVRLDSGDGSELCALSDDAAGAYAPDRMNGRADHQYFVDEDHRIVRLTDTEDRAQPVPGAFGTKDADLGSLAVSRDERLAAGVSRDGASLYVTELATGTDRGAVELRSRGKSAGNRLTAPSWDGLGDLWVADRDPDRPRLLRLRGGVGAPEKIGLPEFHGGRIVALRVSAEGTRIAILIEREGHTKLWLGRIVRSGSTASRTLSVQDLRSVAPQLEDVDAAAWAGDSRLVVAGRESGGVQQLQYVETDGSPGNEPPVPGNRVEHVAASEDQSRPLIAQTLDGIVRLPPNGDWTTVAQHGTAPVYPG